MFKLKAELKKGFVYLFKKMPWSYQDKVYYYQKFKRIPNIREPKLFNEKVLYRKYVHRSLSHFVRSSGPRVLRFNEGEF